MSQTPIYTKLGDDGSTGRLFGGRVSKADPLIGTIGSIDEAVATLGLARANCADHACCEMVLHVQRDLFVASADLAANPHMRERLTPGVSRVTAEMIAWIEERIDRLLVNKPLRPVFVVPGANVSSATLDLARTIVRRAEHNLVAYDAGGAVDQPPSPLVQAYLNRLSDLLYVLARHSAGDREEPMSHDATQAT